MAKTPVTSATDAVPSVVRLRFARSEPAIWLAHLDLMRTFERSIRRAGLPVAYSKGFNPRPHLAFALPIGTGLATRDDYVDVFLDEPVEPDDLMNRLNRSLPSGLTILAARPVSGIGPSLMSLIRGADYRLQGPGLSAAADRLLSLPADQPWLVEKEGKSGKTTVDIRPLFISLKHKDPDDLIIRVKAGSQENLRPDLFLKALASLAGLDPQAAADTAITREQLLIRLDNQQDLQSPIPLSYES